MRFILLTALAFSLALNNPARAGSLELIAFGDSLTSGYGLAAGEGFTVVLEKELRKQGLDVRIVNAGVAGDTASQGLARLDWAIPDGSRGVILELGANDMLRGQDPAVTEKALDEILSRLAGRNIPVLFVGMRAAPNMGADFQARFDALFPRLAEKHGVIFHPFFLEGVAGDQRLNQPDGMHPNAPGVEKIVAGILPKVKELVELAGRPR